jgi:hypothetical protein
VFSFPSLPDKLRRRTGPDTIRLYGIEVPKPVFLDQVIRSKPLDRLQV